MQNTSFPAIARPVSLGMAHAHCNISYDIIRAAQRIVAVIHYGDFFGQQFPIVREDLIGWRLKVVGMLQIVDIGDTFFAREVAREVQEVAHSSLRVRHVQRCCNLTIAHKFSTVGLYSFL